MITEPTVFILGAGASNPYKFPSGAKLAFLICQDLKENSELYKLVQDNIQTKYSSEIDKFREALHLSGRISVDKFLEHRPEFIEIGKLAIAGILIPYEDQNNIFGKTIGERDWYEYLYNHLNTSFESFGKNKISFITYNYDRSLEFFLLKVLENSYRKSPEECYEKLKQIPIIHLHGKLGYLPIESNNNYREYEPSLMSHKLGIAAKQIKIIHEDIDDDPQFKEAHKLLKSAEQIHFLGFGYDDVNLKRLKLENLKGRRIYGTTYKFTNTEITSIKNKIRKRYDVLFNPGQNGVNPVNDKMTCLDYLRNIIEFE